MKQNTPDTSQGSRLEREIERERNQRLKHDEEKAGLSQPDNFHEKDARESGSSTSLNRNAGH